MDYPPLVLRVPRRQIFPLAAFRGVLEQAKTDPQQDLPVLSGEEACAITTRQGKGQEGVSGLQEKRSCLGLLRASVPPW